MRFLIIPLFLLMQSCSFLHHPEPAPQLEMEKLAEDVLTNKDKRGISITVIPVDPPKSDK